MSLRSVLLYSMGFIKLLTPCCARLYGTGKMTGPHEIVLNAGRLTMLATDGMAAFLHVVYAVHTGVNAVRYVLWNFLTIVIYVGMENILICQEIDKSLNCVHVNPRACKTYFKKGNTYSEFLVRAMSLGTK